MKNSGEIFMIALFILLVFVVGDMVGNHHGRYLQKIEDQKIEMCR